MSLFEKIFGPKSVTVQVASAEYQKEGNCLVDVRTPDEVAEMSIPNSINIPLDLLETEIEKLKGYSTVYVSCRSGGRSSTATKLLHKQGIPQAVNIAGGIIAWQNAGLPTEH